MEHNPVRFYVTFDSGSGAIVIVKPFNIGKAFLYTFTYLIFAINGFVNPRFGAVGLNFMFFIAATISWLYLLAGLRVTTWFEPWENSVRRRNLFFYTKRIAYERIAGISFIAHTGPFTGGKVHFVLVDKLNQVGKGWTLTRDMALESSEFAYFSEEIVPALSTMLFGNAEGIAPDYELAEAQLGIVPDKMRHYTRKSGIYHGKRRMFSPFRLQGWLWYIGLILLIMGFTAMIRGKEADSAAWVLSIGAVICVLSASQACRCSFDVENGTLLLGSWLGLRVKRYLVDDYARTQSVRSYGNFIYLGTTVSLFYTKGNRGEGEYVLGSGFSTRYLSSLERETTLLITAARANRTVGAVKSEEKGPC